MQRIIVQNKFYDRIKTYFDKYTEYNNELKYKNESTEFLNYVNEPFILMEEDEFINKLPNLTNCIILGYGYDFYQKLRELHNNGLIHIGLRRFNYNDFANLPVVHIGSNKLVFGKYPVEISIDVDYDDPLYQITSTLPTDIKLNYFFSKYVLKEALPLPETNNIGIREGINVLKTEFLTNIGENIGFDFETSGFPEEYDFKVSGFSFSSRVRMKSYFFDFRKDYGYDESAKTEQNELEFKEFLSLMQEYLEKNSQHVWTYNCSFEIHVCWVLFHKFIELQDAYALCICDDKRGSLKYNVQYYLNSPSWDDNLDKQQSYIDAITENYGSYDEFLVAYSAEPTESDEEYLTAYRSNPQWLHMLKNYYGNSWMACDPEQLGTYCCYDSFYTVALRDKLWDAYGPYCYKTFLYDRYMGAELKSHGIIIDTDKRDQLEKFCNVINYNFYIYFNKLWVTHTINKWKDKFDGLEVPEPIERLLNLTAIKNFSCDIFSDDLVYVGKAIFRGVLSDDAIARMDADGYIDLHILDDLVGADFSDELAGIDEYTAYGFNSFLRKRSVFKYYGEILQQILGIKEFKYKINERVISIIKDDYNKYIDDLNKQWIFSNISIYKAAELYDLVSRCTSWEYSDDDTYDYVVKYIPEFTKDQIPLARAIPSDVADKFRNLADITISPDNPYMYLDISNYIPQEILDKYPELPTIQNYYNYREALSAYNDIKDLNGCIGDYQGGEDQVERYVNMYSATNGFIAFVKEMQVELAGWVLSWDAWNSLVLKPAGKSEEWWEYTYDDYVEFTKEFHKVLINSDFIHTKEYYNIINTDSDFPSFIKGDVFLRGSWWYDDYTKFTTELDGTLESQFCKLGVLYYLNSAARKILTNYIKAMHEVVAKPHVLFNKFTQYEYVDGWDNNERSLRLLYPYNINGMDTKRTGSGYHTWRGKSDYNACLRAEEGYIQTYFDISQAEPRTIAYLSNDPLFKNIYETGKDPYLELAKLTWPDKVDEPDFRENYRPIGKVSLISLCYGRGAASLADANGVPVERIEEVGKAMFGTWTEVSRMREHKLLYMKSTGCAETYLGDRLSGTKDEYYTKAVNYPTQGNAACILMEGFENSILNIRKRGYEIYSETVIHDSNTNMIKVRDLPEIDLCYRRYFRMYIKEKYGIDYKFDLDIFVNFRDKMHYSLDIDTHTIEISGYINDVDYFMKYMSERDITILEDKVKEINSNHLSDFLRNPGGKSHIMCSYPDFNPTATRSVKFILNEHIDGEELLGTPLGEPYYFDKVKKWSEHPTKGHENEENPSIKDAPNKVYPVELMDEILKRG